MLAEHEDIDNVQLFAQHFHGQFECFSKWNQDIGRFGSAEIEKREQTNAETG